MKIDRPKEWWLERAAREPEMPGLDAIPADVAEAIQSSQYPVEAADKLALVRGIAFEEAHTLIRRWEETAMHLD